MRIFEFVPIHDHVHHGDSLIENTFGAGFCIVDEAGRLLSTAHNQNLLRWARLLVESLGAADAAAVADGLAALTVRADRMTQRDYDRAVGRNLFEADLEYAERRSRPAASVA